MLTECAENDAGNNTITGNDDAKKGCVGEYERD